MHCCRKYLAIGNELPSQLALDLVEESDDRGETIVQFRNEVRRLSFKKNSVRRRSSRRVPLRDRTREQLVTK